MGRLPRPGAHPLIQIVCVRRNDAHVLNLFRSEVLVYRQAPPADIARNSSTNRHWRLQHKRISPVSNSGEIASEVMRASVLIEMIVSSRVRWVEQRFGRSDRNHLFDNENAITNKLSTTWFACQKENRVMAADQRRSVSQAKTSWPGFRMAMTPEKWAYPDERIITELVGKRSPKRARVVKREYGDHNTQRSKLTVPSSG